MSTPVTVIATVAVVIAFFFALFLLAVWHDHRRDRRPRVTRLPADPQPTDGDIARTLRKWTDDDVIGDDLGQVLGDAFHDLDAELNKILRDGEQRG